MQASHKSYKCTTRLIVIDTRHYCAVWVWCCTNFVHSARIARNIPPLRGFFLGRVWSHQVLMLAYRAMLIVLSSPFVPNVIHLSLIRTRPAILVA